MISVWICCEFARFFFFFLGDFGIVLLSFVGLIWVVQQW